METLELSVKDLVESGAHFGHQKRRWNPKMKRFIFEERNGICIIDLAKTMEQIRQAVEVVQTIVANHQKILFVGTKKQAKEVVKECAEKADEYYACQRWPGGMMTNLVTIRESIKTLEQIEKKIASGGEGLTKKELLVLNKKREKLDLNFSGVRAMRKLPHLLIVVDPNKEHIAVQEARTLGIPVMALVDTNCDPDLIDHVIACNDDALKSIKLVLEALSEAIVEKKKELNIPLAANPSKQETKVEPPKEEEKES